MAGSGGNESGQENLASWIELAGCFNFRDLGAYRTLDGRQMKPGLVYRSDGLQHLTPGDLDRLCGELGLASVIDLRSHDEVDEDGIGAIGERATIHHIPLFPGVRSREGKGRAEFTMPKNMGELYFLMLTAAAEPIARVVRMLADSSAPIVFHCAAGKDRTGVISSILLSILGVPEETIILDYAFSRQNIDKINARLAESQNYQAMMDVLPEGAFDADPAAMKFLLDKLREEYKSISGWAESAGIDGTVQETLRARLLV